MKTSSISISLFFIILIVTNCTAPRKTTADTKSKPKAKTEDFDKFYDKFHKDSKFQMSRLRFPLKGHNEAGKEWTPANWHVMKGRIYDVDRTKYKVDYKKTDTEFYQKVWLDGSEFNSECRFQLIGGKWYLVYSLEMN